MSNEHDELHIIHTNDLHGKLTRKQAERLRDLKAEQPGALLLDAGDIVKTGNVGLPIAPEPIWKLFALAGYDAAVMGNREFHILREGLALKLKTAPCPVLCANIKDKSNKSLPVTPHAMLQQSDRTIIIVGLTVAMVKSSMKVQVLSHFLFEDPVQVGVQIAESLRNQCDVLIALTHIGFKRDIELAERTILYDVVIGGHSHTELAEPYIVKGTPIVQTGAGAKKAGLIRLKNGKIASELIDL